MSLLTFNISNLTVCVIAGLLCMTNTMGYVRCDKKHRQNMGSFLFNKAKKNLSTEQMAKVGGFVMKNSSAMGSSLSSVK
mgnify:CR=1 FL=1